MDAPLSEAPVFTVGELALRLKVSDATIYAAVDTGLLQCHRIRARPGSRGTLRFTEEQVQAYLEAMCEEAPALKHLRMP